MAHRDLLRAGLARLAHALALAGLREPGAPVPPPPATGSAPVAEPWPEPPPPRRERPGPMLDGKAARSRARREAMLAPALALLLGLAMAQATFGIDGRGLLPVEWRAHPARTAPRAPRRAGWPHDEGGWPTPRPRRRANGSRPHTGRQGHALRLLAGMLAILARRLARAILRQHRRGGLDSRRARTGLAFARRLNRWSLALIVGGGADGPGKGVPHG